MYERMRPSSFAQGALHRLKTRAESLCRIFIVRVFRHKIKGHGKAEKNKAGADGRISGRDQDCEKSVHRRRRKKSCIVDESDCDCRDHEYDFNREGDQR